MVKQSVKVELFYSGAWNDITAGPGVFTDTITIRQGLGDESGGFRPSQITAQLANTDDRFRVSNPMSPLYGLAGRNTPIRVSVNGIIRGIAEASSWSCDQTQDFRQTPRRGRAWTDVTAGGVLQRVSQWTQPLRSALYRYVALSGVTPAEWWPMEDVSGSSVAVSAAGGAAMTPVTAVRYTLPDGTPIPPGGAPDFARGNGIGGSAALPNFQGGGTLSAPIRTDTYNGYAVDWVMQFQAGTDDGGTTSADVLRWTESGTYVLFTVNVVKGHVTVFHANAADAATLASTGSADAALDVYDGSPHHFRYQVQQSGGSYQAQLLIDSAVWATAANFATGMPGTVGQPLKIEWNPGEERGDYLPVAAGHLVIWKSGLNGGQPAVFFALNGRAGERAAARFFRLCTEEGIDYVISANYAKSLPMGPQRPDTLSNLLQEIVTTEDGFLSDDITNLRLYFLARYDRTNQPAALTLTPANFTSLPAEVTDDLGVANVVTASQRDGGDVTATDDTSALGTLPPPAGIGEAKRTADVNLFNPGGDLPQVANWYLRRGTVNLPRFPQLTLDISSLGRTNSNITFETGVQFWTPVGGSMFQTNFQPHEGTFCGKLVPDGVSSTSRTESDQVTGASPGQSWRADAWVKCEVSRNVTANINWFDSAGGYLSTTNGSATAVTAFTWAPITVTGTAPAGAARASLSIDLNGSPPASHILYIDQAIVRPAVLAAIDAVTVGSIIVITGLREYTVRLYVLGWTETIGGFTRSITFTCAPDQQFNVGKLGTQRLAARSTTLNAGINSSATSLTLKMTDVLEQWRTGSNSVPVLIGGELITLGTVGAVSGSGPWTQAVTGCTRSVNGIVKAHSTGDPVTVDNVIRLILKED